MSIRVSTFDDDEIRALIKGAPLPLRRYIEALKRNIVMWNQTTEMAISKIRDQHEEIESLKKQLAEKSS